MEEIDPSEHKIQAQCYQFFHNSYPEYRGLLFHVNNKAKNIIEGNKMKALGVVSGIPDLVFVFDGKPFGIEMKTEIGTLSPSQKDIHAKWTKNGAKIYICRSFVQFQEIIKEIISTK